MGQALRGGSFSILQTAHGHGTDRLFWSIHSLTSAGGASLVLAIVVQEVQWYHGETMQRQLDLTLPLQDRGAIQCPGRQT